MRTVRITGGFPQWRDRAREFLTAQISPDDVLWNGESENSLFGDDDAPLEPKGDAPTVPKSFLSLAHTVSHHASEEKWALLYRVLWRLTHGGERHLLSLASDVEVSRLARMRKEIGRDVHKMHAFVRFKKVGEDTSSGRERFVAWFEPDHRIMPLTAGFFRKRFTGMDWMIFTPTGSATWDGKAVVHGPGVAKIDVPEEEQDELWKSYYKSIFNPARIKVKAMQAEMPKKFWKNLPEAELIEDLIAQGGRRVKGMLEEEGRPLREVKNNAYLGSLKQLSEDQSEIVLQPDNHVGKPLDDLRKVASCCQACPLHEAATGTVFGEGPADARIMIVGEQPGDQEDLLGKPFVGPAGQVLSAALEEVGLDREQIYLTNAVKHFKFEQKGKLRLHKSPSAGEVSQCRPWLIAEILQVKPDIIITLGATAAKSLIDRKFSVTKQRGIVAESSLAPLVIATIHPSYLLRLPDKKEAALERAAFIKDLSLAREQSDYSESTGEFV